MKNDPKIFATSIAGISALVLHNELLDNPHGALFPSQVNSYHNTNNEAGAILAKSEAKPNRQEQVVMEFARITSDPMFTAEEVHRAMFPHETPLTSVRRAISNLTKKGLLVKTNVTKEGQYGKQIYCWRLAEENPQTNLF